MEDVVIPSLKMAEKHAEMIREALDTLDPNNPTVAMLKMFADDVVAEIGTAISEVER